VTPCSDATRRQNKEDHDLNPHRREIHKNLTWNTP